MHGRIGQFTRKQKGNQGETIASRYLESRGFFIIQRQFRTRSGEIDIIAWDGVCHELVFVEVKARESLRFGWPEESVDKKKKSRWLKSAYIFLEAKYPVNTPRYRFDIVSVLIDAMRRTAKVSHFKNIAIQE